MKTIVLKPADLTPQWWVVDATDVPVGRLAARVAQILMGKHRPDYTPHVLCGDFVVVINAEKVKFTGNKWEQKEYVRYTGYPSGQRHVKASEMRARRPGTVIRLAVERMLPKNKLAYKMIQRLKPYAGPEHPHQAQQVKTLKIEG
jgi:large subunit ribosomal protein L13